MRPEDLVLADQGPADIPRLGPWNRGHTTADMNNHTAQSAESAPTVHPLTSELFAAAVLEEMPDSTILVGADGAIAYASGRVEQLLGWPLHDLLGRNVECLLPDSVRSRHQALRANFTNNPKARPMGSGLELNALHRDGSLIPVEVSLSPLQFGGGQYVIVAVRDSRAQRELRHALIDERDRAQAILGSLQEGVVEFDIDDERYVGANQRFCEMIGYPHAEVIATEGRPPWWEPNEGDVFTSLRGRAVAGEIARYEMGLQHRSGRPFRVMVTSNVIHSHGRSILLGFFHDLTEERRVAEELNLARERVAVLEDRDRIARDLHDGVIQRMFAAGLHVQAAIGRPDQDSRLGNVIDEIDEAIKDIRTTIFTLHGRRGVGTGLEHALRVLVAESSRLLGHQPDLDIDGDLADIPDELGTEMLLLLRELLTNVVKHAQATRTTVRVEAVDDNLSISVHDDGVGYTDGATGAGSGLKNLHERARRRAGTARIDRLVSQGTAVCWQVPLHSVAN
jgi:PAS domain S-box-containing protein